METLENSTAENISIRSLNIFWMLDANDVSICEEAAVQPEVDLFPDPAILSFSWLSLVLRDESDDLAFLVPSS